MDSSRPLSAVLTCNGARGKSSDKSPDTDGRSHILLRDSGASTRINI